MPVPITGGMSRGTKVLAGLGRQSPQDAGDGTWDQFNATNTIRFPHPGETEPFARSDTAIPGLAVPGMGGLRELGPSFRTLVGVQAPAAEPIVRDTSAPQAPQVPQSMPAAPAPQPGRPLAAGPVVPEPASSHGRALAEAPDASYGAPSPESPQLAP